MGRYGAHDCTFPSHLGILHKPCCSLYGTRPSLLVEIRVSHTPQGPGVWQFRKLQEASTKHSHITGMETTFGPRSGGDLTCVWGIDVDTHLRPFPFFFKSTGGG